jgi:hypothetical protein
VLHLLLFDQAPLASVDMEGAMENAGESLFVDALLVKTSLF